jgi:ribosomal protein S27E
MDRASRMIAHFISLNCPGCGGALEVYDDMERFACGYCGTKIEVQRRGGTAVLKAASAASTEEHIRADKTADLVRLKEEAQGLSKRREVILNDKIKRQKWGYLIGAALLLVGFLVVRFGGLVMGLSVLMAGILTTSFIRRIGKAMLVDLRELDVKIDVLNGRIEDREKLLDSSRTRPDEVIRCLGKISAHMGHLCIAASSLALTGALFQFEIWRQRPIPLIWR